MNARSAFVVSVLAGLVLGSATAMAAEYAGTPMRAPLDVDVYDQPGGEGQPRSVFLKGGSTVYLLKQSDHWCNVQGDAVPGGPGWIWCGKGDDGKNYALTPTKAEPTEPPVDEKPMGGGTNDETPPAGGGAGGGGAEGGGGE